VLDSQGDAKILPPIPRSNESVNSESIARAATILREARRPIIWAGGGIVTSDATAELIRLAELLQAPIVTTIMGKGGVPAAHPLVLGTVATRPDAQSFLADHDVMLAIGTRFSGLDTADWSLRLPNTLVHVDVDPREPDKNYSATLTVI